MANNISSYTPFESSDAVSYLYFAVFEPMKNIVAHYDILLHLCRKGTLCPRLEALMKCEETTCALQMPTAEQFICLKRVAWISTQLSSQFSNHKAAGESIGCRGESRSTLEGGRCECRGKDCKTCTKGLYRSPKFCFGQTVLVKGYVRGEDSINESKVETHVGLCEVTGVSVSDEGHVYEVRK